MHIITTIGWFAASFAGYLAVGYAGDRWAKRPAARQRWAQLSLRAKINSRVRGFALACVIMAGILAGNAVWHYYGHLPASHWLTFSILPAFYLALDAWLLHKTLRLRRAYRRLGWMTYLVEARHAFGQMTVPAQDNRAGTPWYQDEPQYPANHYAEYVAASHADMDGDQSPTSGSNPSIPTTK